MLKKQHHHNSSRSTSLFEIRLKNLDHDVLILKGNEHEAASALLSGNIVLSVNEPINIKRLTLRLYSTLKLKNELPSNNPNSGRRVISFNKKIYEHVWDHNEFNQYLNKMYEHNSSINGAGSPPALSKNHSTTSLKGLRSKSALNLSSLSSHSSSTTNLSGLSGSSSSNSHVLVSGNYEIPFSAILPGKMPESVEGLPGCSAVYRLEATIDRGKFHSSMITRKHLRVVRTLTTDAVELSETIAVDNTWPKKVEYSLSCPTRALAIGSGSPISMMLVPLLKGLQLGDIKIQLVEFYSYVGNLPPAYSNERIITSKKISKPNPDEMLDKWEIDTFLKIPASLSKCTQDVELFNYVKVRHKIKFNIGLINPDGHVSELRASLPIILFISPFVTVSGKHDDEISEDENNGEEDILFISDSFEQLNQLSNQNQHESSTSLHNSNNSSHTSLTGLVAPPLYERHIYDRLWSDVSPIETPLTSGQSTPRSRQNGFTNPNDIQQFSMSPVDSSLLTENLRQLSLQRQAQEADEHHNNKATFNLDGEESASASNHPQNDYFTPKRPNIRSNQSFMHDLYLATPPVHLSRANSDLNLLKNPGEMSQVPSYQQAMRSDTAVDPSPMYQPPFPGSHINLAEVNRNLIRNNSRNGTNSGSLLSRGGSSLKLSSSRNSSNGSSPSNSTNVSSSNLANLMSRTSSNNLSAYDNNNQNSGNLSPNHLHSNGSASLSSSPRNEVSVAQLSQIANDRNSAIPLRTSSSLGLHNLHFLNKKKDKK
ncbi:unnamed protein product [Candida verbasci]|uniref:Arrestin C-terminal-like domain-containing protein n=1 Tax=Candida verbasci TaxID=1227364 RepID=A0A9W4XK88_9ASCO|nr:unnamed protein product [Candida verbasci]